MGEIWGRYKGGHEEEHEHLVRARVRVKVRVRSGLGLGIGLGFEEEHEHPVVGHRGVLRQEAHLCNRKQGSASRG